MYTQNNMEDPIIMDMLNCRPPGESLPEGYGSIFVGACSNIADKNLKPFPHQLAEEIRFGDRYRHYDWVPRLGKTFVTYCNFYTLHKMGACRFLFIVCPAQLQDNWAKIQSYKMRFNDTQFRAETWKDLKSDVKREGFTLVARNKKDVAMILSVSYESLEKCYGYVLELLELMPDAMIVADESHRISNPESRAATVCLGGQLMMNKGERKIFESLSHKFKYTRTLSGTSNTERSSQLWSQFEFHEEGLTGLSYRDFCRRYESVCPFSGHIVRDNTEDLGRSMAPFSTVLTKDKVAGLPENVYESMIVKLSDEQKRAISDVSSTACADVDGATLTMARLRTYVGKHQQISSGFLIGKGWDEKPTIKYFPQSDKLDTLIKLVESSEDRVIIWCWFRAEEEMVRSALSLAGIDYEWYNGSRKHKDEVFKKFRPESPADGPKVLLGQHARMGEGLDLAGAKHSIHVSYPFSARILIQANERIVMLNSTPGLVTYLVGCSSESYILRRHEEKKRGQDEVLDAAKEWIEVFGASPRSG